MFFAKKVILVEGDTEKFIIPLCCSQLSTQDKKYDLSAENICIVESGGKNNIHIFMRVLNYFKVPYVVLHDVDPIDFCEDKEDKTDKEQQELRTFKENIFIKAALDVGVGKIITVNPEFESITGISKNQVDKNGKVQAAYNKYDTLKVKDYPGNLINIIDLIVDWNHDNPTCEICT
jgi:putative ATP-dependent endonuclease of the OLD family